MSAERLVEEIRNPEGSIKHLTVVDSLGRRYVGREIGIKNDPFFDDGLGYLFEPAYAPKEGLPKADPNEISTTRGRRKPSHAGKEI